MREKKKNAKTRKLTIWILAFVAGKVGEAVEGKPFRVIVKLSILVHYLRVLVESFVEKPLQALCFYVILQLF